jgi:hypothetical protein
MDFVYVALTIVFFAAAAAYVAGCDRLAPFAKASGPKSGDRS